MENANSQGKQVVNCQASENDAPHEVKSSKVIKPKIMMSNLRTGSGQTPENQVKDYAHGDQIDSPLRK